VRRGSLVTLIVIAIVVAAVVTAIALYGGWLPDQASKERERIDLVFWFTTAICIFVFALVASVSLYAVVKFRARPDDDSDGLPIHGHTGLEIAWTAVPAVLVTAIGILSAVVLAQNGRSSTDDALRVEVTGRQFTWTFTYPDAGGLTSSTLRLPVDRSAELAISAVDVIHSFWVPQFGQKQDAVPGQVNDLVVTPTKLGEFPVICTELCGLGHAFMRSKAVVMEPQRFEAWLSQRRNEMGGRGGENAGRAVFEESGCGSCHTFEPAGSNAEVGPDLDTLESAARRAGEELEPFVRESIEEPNAYIERGFPRNVMPPFDLPDEQLDALVQYLVEGQQGQG
jgi:cytochrome c oxidase subunit 2